MTVSEMLSKMDSAEISEWHAYFLNEQEDRLQAEAEARSKARKMG